MVSVSDIMSSNAVTENNTKKKKKNTVNLTVSPSYNKVVVPLIHAGGGDPSLLLEQYPNFDADSIPPDGIRLHHSRGIPKTDTLPYLHGAVYLKDIVVARGLLACGASIWKKTAISGIVPISFTIGSLYATSIKKKLEMLDLLLAHPGGMETLDEPCNQGFTVLHGAVLHTNVEMVKKLLEMGADPTVQTNEGRTPYILALIHGYKSEIAGILEDAVHTFPVLSVGEWRPHIHHQFPRHYRLALRTLVILAKARNLKASTKKMLVPRYQTANLCFLPEEVLQFMYTFLCVLPLPDNWFDET